MNPRAFITKRWSLGATALLLTGLLLGACASQGPQAPETLDARRAAAALAAENRVAARLEQLKLRPAALRPFLAAFPKGGDIHSHLSGAVYAESLLAWAAEDGRCGNPEVGYLSLALPSGACDASKGDVAVAALLNNATTSNRLINALSTRNYRLGRLSGHGQFFSSFDRFGPATLTRRGDMLAEVADRAARQNIVYLELMQSPGMAQARALGAKLRWIADPAAFRSALLAEGLDQVARAARLEVSTAEARMMALLRCQARAPEPGCAMTIRYIAQVIRTFPREQVFAQTLLASILVRQDPRFVGLNFVAPEDDRITLRDYSRQMKIKELRFHIRDAIDVAGARRIGHGVDVLYETDADKLLAQMAEQQILVEVNLTSNAIILGVEGAQHPFDSYRAAGVPLTLSTDDEGVARIDLTQEYQRAVQSYDLDYRFLKTLSRNALTYSFVEGQSLWSDAAATLPNPACQAARPGAEQRPPACSAFLAGSTKAQLQWQLESRFSTFEQAF